MTIQIPDKIQELLNLFSFRGNTKLRPEGAVVEYTPEMIEEYIKCKQDPIYFIKKYIYIVHPDRGVVKFDLYDYQEDMINAYHFNKKVIFLTARQQGKCLSIDTKVKIKQKSTNEIFECTLGDFYVWKKFKETNFQQKITEEQ